MSKRTRVFVLVASSILLVGLGSAGVASYVGLQNIRLLGGNGAVELAYVPSSATLVAYADVRDILQSELGRTLAAHFISSHQNNDGPQVFEQVGIDPQKDVYSVLVVGLPALQPPVDGKPVPHAFALVRGHFDYPRIEAVVTGHGGAIDVYQGTRFASLKGPDIGTNVALAFLDDELMAIGEVGAVRQALDTKIAGVGGIKENDELLALIKRVDDGSSWAVARSDALQQQAPIPSEVSRQLPAISWFAARGTIDDHLSGTLFAQTKDEQSAKDLREVISGLLAFGRMQAGQQPEFKALVDSIQLGGEGSQVSVAFSVPPAMVEKFTPRARAPRPSAPDASIERPRPAAKAPAGSI